jgi:uncharacterized protein YdhG (YjbR/CyaY superfamily)
MENGNAPATKQDVTELRTELKRDITELRTEVKQDITELRTELKQDITELRTEVKQDIEMLRSEVHHVHDSLIERIADSETRLLKAFYTFAESNQTRLAVIETDSDAVKKRVGILEERVLELERKVNFPQPPPQ